MRILGPLVWATTSALTLTPARALASLVTSEPSTRSSAGRLRAAPAAPSTFSTSRTSPTATLYCLPPVLTMAYTTAPSTTRESLLVEGIPQPRRTGSDYRKRLSALKRARYGGPQALRRRILRGPLIDRMLPSMPTKCWLENRQNDK